MISKQVLACTASIYVGRGSARQTEPAEPPRGHAEANGARLSGAPEKFPPLARTGPGSGLGAAERTCMSLISSENL